MQGPTDTSASAKPTFTLVNTEINDKVRAKFESLQAKAKDQLTYLKEVTKLLSSTPNYSGFSTRVGTNNSHRIMLQRACYLRLFTSRKGNSLTLHTANKLDNFRNFGVTLMGRLKPDRRPLVKDQLKVQFAYSLPVFIFDEVRFSEVGFFNRNRINWRQASVVDTVTGVELSKFDNSMSLYYKNCIEQRPDHSPHSVVLRFIATPMQLQGALVDYKVGIDFKGHIRQRLSLAHQITRDLRAGLSWMRLQNQFFGTWTSTERQRVTTARDYTTFTDDSINASLLANNMSTVGPLLHFKELTAYPFAFINLFLTRSQGRFAPETAFGFGLDLFKLEQMKIRGLVNLLRHHEGGNMQLKVVYHD